MILNLERTAHAGGILTVVVGEDTQAGLRVGSESVAFAGSGSVVCTCKAGIQGSVPDGPLLVYGQQFCKHALYAIRNRHDLVLTSDAVRPVKVTVPLRLDLSVVVHPDDKWATLVGRDGSLIKFCYLSDGLTRMDLYHAVIPFLASEIEQARCKSCGRHAYTLFDKMVIVDGQPPVWEVAKIYDNIRKTEFCRNCDFTAMIPQL